MIKSILLKPIVFKSGKSGYTGIDSLENFIIRANISEGETQNYKRLTVVTEEVIFFNNGNNNNNNEVNYNESNNNASSN